MINAKIKCPYCQAPNPVNYKHKSCGCIVCHQTIKIHKAEIIEAPKDEIIYDSGYDENGKKLPSTKSVAIMCFLTGWLGIDFMVYKVPLRALFCIIFCWTGVPVVLSIFRGLDILALEPDEIEEYYQRRGHFSKSGHKYAIYKDENSEELKRELDLAKEASKKSEEED